MKLTLDPRTKLLILVLIPGILSGFVSMMVICFRKIVPMTVFALVGFMSWQVLALTTALAAIGAVIGMRLGKTMLKKHFIKAGIA